MSLKAQTRSHDCRRHPPHQQQIPAGHTEHGARIGGRGGGCVVSKRGRELCALRTVRGLPGYHTPAIFTTLSKHRQPIERASSCSRQCLSYPERDDLTRACTPTPATPRYIATRQEVIRNTNDFTRIETCVRTQRRGLTLKDTPPLFPYFLRVLTTRGLGAR